MCVVLSDGNTWCREMRIVTFAKCTFFISV
jgi:hypothetical protein